MTEQTNPIAGPWRAVLSDDYGYLIADDEIDDHAIIEAAVVRGDAMPVVESADDGDEPPVERMPGTYTTQDVLYTEDLGGQELDDIRAAWRRTQAVAKALNDAAEVDRLRAELAATEQQLSTMKAYYIRRMDRRRELLDAARDEATELRAERDRYAAAWHQTRSAMIDQHTAGLHMLEIADCKACTEAADECDGEYACTEYKRWQASYEAALSLEPHSPAETSATPEQPAPDSGAPLDVATNA